MRHGFRYCDYEQARNEIVVYSENCKLPLEYSNINPHLSAGYHAVSSCRFLVQRKEMG